MVAYRGHLSTTTPYLPPPPPLPPPALAPAPAPSPLIGERLVGRPGHAVRQRRDHPHQVQLHEPSVAPPLPRRGRNAQAHRRACSLAFLPQHNPYLLVYQPLIEPANFVLLTQAHRRAGHPRRARRRWHEHLPLSGTTGTTEDEAGRLADLDRLCPGRPWALDQPLRYKT